MQFLSSFFVEDYSPPAPRNIKGKQMFRKGTERQKQTAESEEQSIPAQPQHVAMVRQAGKPSTVHDVVIRCGVNIIPSKIR